eukprot:UN26455
MTKIWVKKGETVIEQGETGGRTYYVMESGKIDVIEFGVFQVSIQPGWCFGEKSFVFGDPRSASCVASEDSVLWVLDRREFDRVISK